MQVESSQSQSTQNDVVQTEQSVSLNSPIARPNACGFLWNKSMMLSMNCLGYANAQFMQPEPSKYAFSPSLEAKTFMQPEHPYFAHHPGRFFYLKNEQTSEIFSIPFAPCKTKLDTFIFKVLPESIEWLVLHDGLEIMLSVKLAADRALEQWQISLKEANKTGVSGDCNASKWSIYAYFPFGYMSWMNQSACFDDNANAIVGTYVTPYQKLEDYPSLKNTAQKTFLSADIPATSWCANQTVFEGLGGLGAPQGLKAECLNEQDAIYETPCAVIHHSIDLKDEQPQTINYLFGPCHNNTEILELRTQYFLPIIQTVAMQTKNSAQYGHLNMTSPDVEFNRFVNLWLPRQVEYHCEVNRLTTDPQTRNYIQDNIGSCFIEPSRAKTCLLTSLSQQHASGEMPDGILIHPDAELKYINQIPHSDHCIWLPILLEVYLDQTNDVAFLTTQVSFADSPATKTVYEHIELGLAYLLSRRDNRGLSFIDQGDWCDPMNMVGARGKGVSAWLTMASAYALKIWLSIIEKYGEHDPKVASQNLERTNNIKQWRDELDSLYTHINQHCWDEHWYGRGITDNGELFGINKDLEGRIYLNPQSWALLSGCADQQQQKSINKAVTQHLQTPFGNMMLAPSYTQMDERIGRLTQKHMGCAENGSVYNHAFVFWIFAMYESGNAKQGFLCVKEMLNATLSEQSGQLPIYVPNYFRGAYYQAPEQAGKSSHLFNTGTAAWLYRIVIEKIAGLQGHGPDLLVQPQLPDEWSSLNIKYRFRDATFDIAIHKTATLTSKLLINGLSVQGNRISNIEPNTHYKINLELPTPPPIAKPKLTVVMGVSGSGKSSIAQRLAEQTGAIFIEGDDLHSTLSKRKMSQGRPLDNTDRAPWIARLIDTTKQKLLHGYDVVLCFSGLQYQHRQQLNEALRAHASHVAQLFLEVSQREVEARLSSRENHFFNPKLVHSQFEALQIPTADEVIVIDANTEQSKVVSACLKHITNA